MLLFVWFLYVYVTKVFWCNSICNIFINPTGTKTRTADGDNNIIYIKSIRYGNKFLRYFKVHAAGRLLLPAPQDLCKSRKLNEWTTLTLLDKRSYVTFIPKLTNIHYPRGLNYELTSHLGGLLSSDPFSW